MLSDAFNRLTGLRKYLGPALLAVVVFVLVAAAFFILDKYLSYRLVESYVSALSDVFNLNRHLASAATLLVFVLFTFLISAAFSFQKRKRWIGIAGIVALLVLNSILLWRGTSSQFFTADGKPIKCYILDRDGVKYRERAGIDPETGRVCVDVTAEMLDRLKEYERGRRPKRLLSQDVVFFDSASGHPIVWYEELPSKKIELFDLMGFHPELGTQLKPITREVVMKWREQLDDERRERLLQEAKARAPKQIDPKDAVFFNPLTGEAQVYFARNPNGEYEFFDNKGYHPRTGEQLRAVSKDLVQEWQRYEQQKAAKTAPPSNQPPAIIPQPVPHRDGNIPHECDRLAANPNDPRRFPNVAGVSLEVLGAAPNEAILECTKAVAEFPNELRFLYQLSRSLELVDPRRSAALYSRLIERNYFAAYDNLGWMYFYGRFVRQDRVTAESLFRKGAELGDPDCMHSLGKLIEAERPDEAIRWYQSAVRLGHTDAPNDLIRLQQASYRQYQQNEAAGEVMRNIFDGILQMRRSR